LGGRAAGLGGLDLPRPHRHLPRAGGELIGQIGQLPVDPVQRAERFSGDGDGHAGFQGMELRV
jgi:hypothetical protein